MISAKLALAIRCQAKRAASWESGVEPLVRLGLLQRSEVEEFFTVRLGWVYPIWDLGWQKRMDLLLNYERGIENLIFNGRPGLYFYNNLHHSLSMGLLSADHVLSGKRKSEKWDVESREFESYQLVE